MEVVLGISALRAETDPPDYFSRKLLGIPLFQWNLMAAIEAAAGDRLVVVTNDSFVQEFCCQFDVCVDWVGGMPLPSSVTRGWKASKHVGNYAKRNGITEALLVVLFHEYPLRSPAFIRSVVQESMRYRSPVQVGSGRFWNPAFTFAQQEGQWTAVGQSSCHALFQVEPIVFSGFLSPRGKRCFGNLSAGRWAREDRSDDREFSQELALLVDADVGGVRCDRFQRAKNQVVCVSVTDLPLSHRIIDAASLQRAEAVLRKHSEWWKPGAQGRHENNRGILFASEAEPKKGFSRTVRVHSIAGEFLSEREISSLESPRTLRQQLQIPDGVAAIVVGQEVHDLPSSPSEDSTLWLMQREFFSSRPCVSFQERGIANFNLGASPIVLTDGEIEVVVKDQTLKLVPQVPEHADQLRITLYDAGLSLTYQLCLSYGPHGWQERGPVEDLIRGETIAVDRLGVDAELLLPFDALFGIVQYLSPAVPTSERLSTSDCLSLAGWTHFDFAQGDWIDPESGLTQSADGLPFWDWSGKLVLASDERTTDRWQVVLEDGQ